MDKEGWKKKSWDVSTKEIQQKESIVSEWSRFVEKPEYLRRIHSIWLSEVEVDEIQKKVKEEKNTKEPKTDLQNTYDQQRSADEDDVKLTKIEHLFNKLQDQGLIKDYNKLEEEVAQPTKTNKAQPNFKKVERKQLKS